MQAYDAARFDPPAPLAFVMIKTAQPGVEIRDVPMLLDTGAGASLLPRSLVAAVITPSAKQYEIEAFDGTRSNSLAIDAELLFLGKSFRGQFRLVDGWYGILGRNILNNLMLLFDGPSRTWTESR